MSAGLYITGSSKRTDQQGENVMSRLSTRVVLSVLISLGVILAIFSSVQGASSSNGMGARLVNGAMTNFNHDRFTVAEKAEYQSQLDAYIDSLEGGKGGGCESEQRSSPDL
jgi:hypothetical protein